MEHFKANLNDFSYEFFLAKKNCNFFLLTEVTLELDEIAIYHGTAHESSHIVKSIIDSPYSLVFPSEPHNDH